jgi:multidrug efflux pump subunit AcrA (membrane-fusion protein)
MEKKKSVKTLGMILGTVIAAGALMFGPNLLTASGDEDGTKAANSEAPLLSVKTENAGRRTLRAFLEVNGDIVSRQEADVFPDVAGKLVRVSAALGSQVRKGDVIAEVDPSKPGITYMSSPVYAPISGTVSRTPLPVGTAVGTGSAITAIALTGNPEITARIPEREISGLKTGLKAEVYLPAYPGESFSATLSHVAPVLDAASRTKQITLTFDRTDGRINAGMFARLRINTRTYTDVLTVPAEAAATRQGETAVYVLRDAVAGPARVERRAVQTGLSLGGWTEIKSGLDEGEAVVVQGQRLLAGGEAVRVIAGDGK